MVLTLNKYMAMGPSGARCQTRRQHIANENSHFVVKTFVFYFCVTTQSKKTKIQGITSDPNICSQHSYLRILFA
jgi:hypothetical protein